MSDPAKISDLRTKYENYIGDDIPEGYKFVLLVFREGSDAEVKAETAGIAFASNAEAEQAVGVVTAFVKMVEDAARIAIAKAKG